MTFFSNILVFYNDAFPDIQSVVMKLVDKNKAKLKIIDVFDNFDQYIDLLPPSSSIEELKDVIISERREEILKHFKADDQMQDRFEVVIKFGNPTVEVIKEVLAFDHDIVIKAASGNKTFKDRLFGNVAVRLLRKCPCPVFIVKPSESVSFKNILTPVDPEINPGESFSDKPSDERICKKIIDVSLFMAQIENSFLHILHCWFLPGQTLLTSGRSRIASDQLNQMAVLGEKIHTQKMNTLLSEYDLSKVPYSLVIEKGEPGEKIVDYANKNQIDLIIMGTVGRSGLSGMLIGNTAERVIEQVDCSVLTLKPSHFRSPVKTGDDVSF